MLKLAYDHHMMVAEISSFTWIVDLCSLSPSEGAGHGRL